jgi:co-chaperonin GroES (HSP10)
MTNGRPLWGNVLIRPEAPSQKTKSGIEMPDSQTKGNTLIGKIVEIGAGSLAWDGSPIPIEPGITREATVIFKKYEAEEVHLNGETLYLVDQRQVMMVLN